MLSLGCLLDIQKELSSRRLWIEEARSGERSVLDMILEKLQIQSVFSIN